MSGSCSVGSEGSPSSTTSSRNSTKSAFRCSERREGQDDVFVTVTAFRKCFEVIQTSMHFLNYRDISFWGKNQLSSPITLSFKLYNI